MITYSLGINCYVILDDLCSWLCCSHFTAGHMYGDQANIKFVMVEKLLHACIFLGYDMHNQHG